VFPARVNNTETENLEGELLDNSLRDSRSRDSTVVGKVDEKQTAMYYLRDPRILVNLAVMTFMWVTCSFNYYMIALYVKYLPGNIYVNCIAGAVAELFANATGGLLYAKLGMKISITSLFVMSAIGGFCILLVGAEDVFWMPFFVVIAKFGLSGVISILYVSNVDVFPTLFCSTAIGICNFASRFLTIFSAQVAEIEPPLPMILFSSLFLAGSVLIHFAKPTSKK